ncbi:MAG TPA: hypothetical protein P5228_02255 [Bacteroidales bacterium]|nr:hypothetical protein [Bacteroidales bacterium]
MSDNTHSFDNLDFEALMLSKPWDALLPEEKALLEGIVAGEEEYTLMRETLLMITGTEVSPEPPLNPGLKDRLMDAYDRQYPAQAPPAARIRMMVPRKTWLSVAAAAAFFIAVASVWYLITQPFDRVLNPQPQLAENLKDTLVVPGASSVEDATNEKGQADPGSTIENLYQTKDLQDQGKYPQNPVASQYVQDTTLDDASAFREVAVRAPALVPKPEGVTMAKEDIGKMGKNLSPDRQQNDLSQKQQLKSEDETVVKQVAIVSERSRLQKYVPEKKLRTTPRPVSSDPQLLDFLFACP